jgi:putative NADH-flavin reductase
MQITVFGATGRTGKLVVEQALAEGYEVVAFARSPSKLGTENARLRVVQGDIQDADAVRRAIAGSEAVISVLGPTSNAPDFAVSKGMRNILAGMEKEKVRRLIVSTGAGVVQPGDEPRLPDKVIGALLKIVSGNVLADMASTVELVKASDRDWTIVRVPRLTDDVVTGKVRAGAVGKDIGIRVGRADMARFILEQLKNDTWMKRAPAISN